MAPHRISTLHLLYAKDTHKPISWSDVVLPLTIHPKKGTLEGEDSVQVRPNQALCLASLGRSSQGPITILMRSGAGSRAGNLSKHSLLLLCMVLLICLFVCLLDMLTILKRFLQSSFRSLMLGRSLSLTQSSPHW